MTHWPWILVSLVGVVCLVLAWRWHTRAARLERKRLKALRRSNQKWLAKQRQHLDSQRRVH